MLSNNCETCLNGMFQALVEPLRRSPRSLFILSLMFVSDSGDRLLIDSFEFKMKFWLNCLSSRVLAYKSFGFRFPESSQTSTEGSPLTFNFCPSGPFSGQ